MLGGKGDPNIFLDLLQYAKYTPDEIDRISQFATKVGQLATTVGWVVGAIFTVKDILEMMGVLDKDDKAEKLLEDIALKVDAMYKYLQATDKKQQFELAVQWRSKVQGVRTSMSNLALSRSSGNLDTLRESSRLMMDECLGPMLDPGMGDIAFINATYGGYPTPHTYVNEKPTHWTAYAYPLWMQTTGGVPVNFGYAADLAAQIWDPGYYLDVLVEAVGVRIAALAAIEPAFRSTAYDRDDLRTIHRGLVAFVTKWEKALLKTAIVGPIDPIPDYDSGGHRIYHPWFPDEGSDLVWTWPEHMRPALPLGAIDPVSGVSAFDPFWRDGLDLKYLGPNRYWYVANYGAAASAAYGRLGAMLEFVREHCGVRRLRDLRDSVYELIGPPAGSEFATVSDATFHLEAIAGGGAALSFGAGTEEVDLGVLGTFAGKPGKKYKARRVFQPAVKRFRVPMARRTDLSKIQLGYRIRLSVSHGSGAIGADLPIDTSVILSKFSNVTIPEDVPPIFPSTSQVHEIASDKASVYDVLQSDLFSTHEETVYENTGSVPGKQRLYQGRRPGMISARVKVDFEFDAQNPDHAFMGFANVSVGTLDPGAARDGFILFVEVFETRVVAKFDPPSDAISEDMVAAMSLHFAPSFLVVEPDYFKDREAGFRGMQAAVDSVEDKYRESKMFLGPYEPITRIERAAQEEEVLLNLFEEYAERSPELARDLTATYSVPAVSWR